MKKNLTKQERFKLIELNEAKPKGRSEPIKETFEKVHEKPVSKMTRRELIGAGLVPTFGTIWAPSVLSLLAPYNAQAADLICTAAGGSGDWCAFMAYNMAGGAGLSANALPLTRDGGFIPVKNGPDGTPQGGYSTLGMGHNPEVELEFKPDSNNQQSVFYRDSGILAGIRTELARIAALNILSAEERTRVNAILQNTHFILMCAHSGDDSGMNRADMTGLVMKGGLTGNLLQNLGTNGTPIGINALAAVIQPPAALNVSGQGSIDGALGFSGVLAQQLSGPQQANMMRAISGLSENQAVKYINRTGGSILQQLMGCANRDNTNLISNTGNLNTNPLRNPAVAAAWTITANTNPNDGNFVRATVTYNVLLKNASTGGCIDPGNDYHNGSRTSGDTNDTNNGIALARMLATAAILDKKFFMHVTTDGGVRSPISGIAGGPWTTDNGQAGVQYCMAYDPKGLSRASGTQISYFNDAQAAAEDFGPLGSTLERHTAAAYVQYLSFNNKLSVIEQVLPRMFTSVELDAILKLYAS